jgi:hypothetical protein
MSKHCPSFAVRESRQTAPGCSPALDTSGAFAKLLRRTALLLLMLGLVAVAGCATKPSGSRDYIPGKGWVPND